MSHREIVGLVGKKRAGKDSFAERLVHHWGWERVAFADPLREAALALDPIISYTGGSFHPDATDRPRHFRLSDHVHQFGWEEAKSAPEVRRTLQNYGVAIRELWPTFWIDVAKRRVDQIPGPVVVTDVRFLNEARAIKDWGGWLVRIVRPGQPDDGDQHVSEVEQDSIETDFEVVNDGSILDLHEGVDSLIETLEVMDDLGITSKLLQDIEAQVQADGPVWFDGEPRSVDA